MAGFAGDSEERSSVIGAKSASFRCALTAVALLCTAPAFAGSTDSFRQTASPDLLANIGGQPSAQERESFAAIFAAIDAKKWTDAVRLIDTAPRGPMQHVARAELYLAAGSPKVEAAQLQSLLNDAPWLPQAEQLERMATKRGATDLPLRPGTRRFSFLGSAPKRGLPDGVATASGLREKLQAEIKVDNPAGAEALLNEQVALLDEAAIAELRYRVAWSYYIENDDVSRALPAQSPANGARRPNGSTPSPTGGWAIIAKPLQALTAYRALPIMTNCVLRHCSGVAAQPWRRASRSKCNRGFRLQPAFRKASTVFSLPKHWAWRRLPPRSKSVWHRIGRR
jgi:hypothetical protein